jgi:ATP-dependent phosphofructokinase / diphosphate-dependent phosphofructokinase
MAKKIGIVTCGGDSPGLNVVIRAVVKTAVGKYGYEVIGFKDGYRGLVINDYIKLELPKVSGLLDRGGTILGTSRDNPARFKVEENGVVKYVDMCDQVIKNVKEHGLDCLVTIGGDGTLTGARDFMRRGLNVIGVPKTIDNDLDATDTTFGFMTAVDTATEAIDKLHSTAESHHRVMILELMGRNAGWIALEAGMAGGADVILIPEIPYDLTKVARKIVERNQAGKNFSIIVVAEGAIPKGGVIPQDGPEHIRLGGVSHVISRDLEEATGIESRVTVLGYIQRGGKPSAFDRILSTRFGVAAVEFIEAGKLGVMVSLQGNTITSVPLENAVGKIKNVPVDGELIRIARSVGVEFGD